MSPHAPRPGAEFAGRTALVTGAAQGIGASVARALADVGTTVAATDRQVEPLHQVAEEHRDGDIRPFPLDVTDRTAVESVVDRVEREVGPIDILVNVAGILRTAPATKLSARDWEETFAVNATGVFHTGQVLGSRMAERNRGCVITVGSNAVGVPRTGMAAYAASKAASTMFTKCLGLELARSGVRCNIVAPGSTDTPMQRQLWTDSDAERRVVEGDPENWRTGIPLGRLAQPQDIAEAVVFLASDRARHITLHELYVDGGATLN
ncbi:2,3-dihydro-2,3-dihydroxybenzoate dehydrogenase [Streptomyces sp. NPDC005438]|uniref:2,3-dihydro-2,3-dihydroxybenzoate dehydrogenase n=1 Tax=Streptomyces sp. NPDC005438 TaxID=3156880 RepID=UPI0033B81BD9